MPYRVGLGWVGICHWLHGTCGFPNLRRTRLHEHHRKYSPQVSDVAGLACPRTPSLIVRNFVSISASRTSKGRKSHPPLAAVTTAQPAPAPRRSAREAAVSALPPTLRRVTTAAQLQSVVPRAAAEEMGATVVVVSPEMGSLPAAAAGVPGVVLAVTPSLALVTERAMLPAWQPKAWMIMVVAVALGMVGE